MEIGWQFDRTLPRMPLLAANVVATSQPLAAQAGLRMLLAGGNAVDAAVACAIALTVVEPTSVGIGGDAFALVWDGSGLHGLNASGRSPAAWSPGRFRGMEGIPDAGWESVTVPGAVSGWVELHRCFGRLPFERLFEPAIAYAQDGFPVSPTVASQWAAQATPRLAGRADWAAAFLPGGRPPRAGERFRFPDQARTLARIAVTGGEAFYRGDLARRMVAHSAGEGGALDLDDLAAHRCEWVQPIWLDAMGVTVHEIPPSGQGIAALMALGMLESLDLGSDPDSVDAAHLQIEAMKLAFADAYGHVADPDAMRVSADDLLDPGYLGARAELIDPARAKAYGPGEPRREGTVYLTAADADGMMVSFIQSNFWGFGSGVVVPGTGISMQNRGSGFTLRPGHPNEVGGAKRPFHTIIPGFVTEGGRALMSFGVMGGNMQPQGHVQTLTRIFRFGRNPQAACDAPRWRIQGREVLVEDHFPESVVAGLSARGHVVRREAPGSTDFGSGQFIVKMDSGYLAASDPRRDGQAVGY